jgi:hypothetical protein
MVGAGLSCHIRWEDSEEVIDRGLSKKAAKADAVFKILQASEHSKSHYDSWACKSQGAEAMEVSTTASTSSGSLPSSKGSSRTSNRDGNGSS